MARKNDDHAEAEEVVAGAGQQRPAGCRCPARPGWRRTGGRRSRRRGRCRGSRAASGRSPSEHGDVGDAEVLRDDERRGAHRRRRQDRADAGRGEHAAGRLLRVAGRLEDRPGERAQGDRGRRTGAGHGAEQEAGGRHGAARCRCGAAEQRELILDEEPAGAHPLQDRAVDREQHDVGRGDVERDTEEAAGLVVEAVDDLLEVETDVRDRPADRQVAAVVGVGEEQDADHRQHQARWYGGPPRAPAAAGRPATTSRVQQRALAVEEALEPAADAALRERQHRVEPDDQRQRGERPVDEPGSSRSSRSTGGAGPGAVADEDQRQRDGEEEDQVVLAALRQRAEHLLQHEERDQEAPQVDGEVDAGESRRPGRSSSYSAARRSASASDSSRPWVVVGVDMLGNVGM